MDPANKQLQIATCRWNIEQWLRPQIAQWLQLELPILDWVFDLGNNFLIMLITIHLDPQSTEVPFRKKGTWMCYDQHGNTRRAKVRSGGKTYVASQRILLECHLPATGTLVQIQWNSQHSYHVTPLLECDRLESSKSLFSLQSGGSIGACLRIRDMDHLLDTWLRYHRFLGIQHFWIFLNQPTYTMSTTNVPFPFSGGTTVSSDITWIPYNFYAPDMVHNTPNHSYSRSSILRHGKHFWQSTTQMQCLYHAKRLGLQWILTLDVDEYLWIPTHPHPHLEQQQQTNKNATTGTLQSLLESHNNNTWDFPSTKKDTLSSLSDTSMTTVNKNDPIGALTLWSIPFGDKQVPPPKKRNQHSSTIHMTSNTTTSSSAAAMSSSSPFVLDYVYRRPLQRIRAQRMDRQKCLYHVPIATDITIHQLRQGGKEVVVSMDTVRIHHYKQPHLGVFQAKSVEELEMDTSLRDFYYDHIK